MNAWQTLSSEEVYATPWIRVRRDEVLNHNKNPLTYSVIELVNPCVVVLPFNDKGELLLIKNFRYTLGRAAWGTPAGFCDEGEDLLAAAKRELQEEAGLASADWTNMGTYSMAAGVGNIPCTFFLARNAYETDGKRDEEEYITQRQYLPLATINELIMSGKIEEAPLLIGLYLAKLHGV